jgi:DivIVA domain-containing protein
MNPSEIRNATFSNVRRGYDPEEVDAHLRDAAAALDRAGEDLAQMQEELAELREREVALRASMTAMSNAREEIMAVAHAEATQVAERAAQRADLTVAWAEDQAAEIVMDARRQALEVIAAARSDADYLLETAHTASLPLTAKIEQLRAVIRRTENLMRGLASGALSDLDQAHLMLDEAPETPEVQIVFTDPEEVNETEASVSPLPAAVDRLLSHLREIG